MRSLISWSIDSFIKVLAEVQKERHGRDWGRSLSHSGLAAHIDYRNVIRHEGCFCGGLRAPVRERSGYVGSLKVNGAKRSPYFNGARPPKSLLWLRYAICTLSVGHTKSWRKRSHQSPPSRSKPTRMETSAATISPTKVSS